MNFSLGQNLEAKVADRETGELKKVKILDNLSTSGNYNFIADSLRLSDLQTRAFTSFFNRVTSTSTPPTRPMPAILSQEAR